MKIYLIGYMASGKSKLGKELAEFLGFSFVDIDDVFEEKYRIGIVDFFEKYGEAAFRSMEHKLLLDTELLENTVIATGGGTPCSDENIRFIRSNGISIYIQMSIDDLVSRLKSVKRKRPLLKNIPLHDLGDFIREQLKERDLFYLQADYVVQGPVNDLAALADFIRGLTK